MYVSFIFYTFQPIYINEPTQKIDLYRFQFVWYNKP